MSDFDTIIVGAGVAGLTCATYLHRKGKTVLVLEAQAAVGGRVRTDRVSGYLLDHGFQVFQTHYPEARQLLDYETLPMGAFDPGAKIATKEAFLTAANPFKKPQTFLRVLVDNYGTLGDKLKIAQLMNQVRNQSLDELLQTPQPSTMQFLLDYGFSDKIITLFFRPFFGGVFLEDELKTAANFFLFNFKLFAEGEVVLPERGMQAIPEQLAAKLPHGSIRLNTKVNSVAKDRVTLQNGEVIKARHVVVAADPKTADAWLRPDETPTFNGTSCYYFAADRSPMKGAKYLLLNPDRIQTVKHVCVPSDIAPTYAPDGKSLVSVTVKTDDSTDENATITAIKTELVHWFGGEPAKWEFLRAYHLPQSLVLFDNPVIDPQYVDSQGVYRCGDYLLYPSLNAAMRSGREVAELITNQTK